MGIRTENLVVHYDMQTVDEGFLIDQASDIDAEIFGATQVEGEYGPAFSFDGTNDYFLLGDVLDFLVQAEPFTIIVNFDLPDPSEQKLNFIFGSTASATEAGLFIGYDNRQLSGSSQSVTNKALRVYLSNGSVGISLHEENANTNGLISVAMRSDGSVLEMIHNGLVVGSIALPSAAVSHFSPVTFGNWLRNGVPQAFWAKMNSYSLFIYDAKININEITATYSRFVEGTITENLAAESFRIHSFRADGEAGPIVSMTSSTGTFSVPVPPPYHPQYITVSLNIGNIWTPESDVILDQTCFPKDPSTTPYYFRCTIAGTTGGTEPTWPTSPPGALVSDGDAQWELVERIVQPITHGPLIPQ